MQFSLLPLALLAATTSAQGGWPQGSQAVSNSYPQPPSQQQPQPQGSWTYQQQYSQPQHNQPQYNQPQYNQPKPDSGFKTISPAEADDWRSCTNGFLLSIDRGTDGSGPACNFWECLHIQASKWGRGGLLTAASEILSPVCSATNVIASVGGHLPFVGGLFGKV